MTSEEIILTPAQLDEAGMLTIRANEEEIQKKVPVPEKPVE